MNKNSTHIYKKNNIKNERNNTKYLNNKNLNLNKDKL